MQAEKSPVISILGHKIRIDAISNPQLQRILRDRIKTRVVDSNFRQQYSDSEYSDYDAYQGEYTESPD